AAPRPTTPGGPGATCGAGTPPATWPSTLFWRGGLRAALRPAGARRGALRPPGRRPVGRGVLRPTRRRRRRTAVAGRARHRPRRLRGGGRRHGRVAGGDEDARDRVAAGGGPGARRRPR